MYAQSTRPLTQAELDLICSVWADAGSDDSTDQWLNLWDGGQADEHPEQRDAISSLAADVGLQTKIEDGVLWVQKTQQLHDEIGERWL